MIVTQNRSLTKPLAPFHRNGAIHNHHAVARGVAYIHTGVLFDHAIGNFGACHQNTIAIGRALWPKLKLTRIIVIHLGEFVVGAIQPRPLHTDVGPPFSRYIFARLGGVGVIDRLIKRVANPQPNAAEAKASQQPDAQKANTDDCGDHSARAGVFHILYYNLSQYLPKYGNALLNALWLRIREIKPESILPAV